jgi:HEAT repeat protein
MDDPRGLPNVLALARQPGQEQAEAVRVLATFRSREVVPVLLDRLDDGNAAVRQAAWQGLPQVVRDLFPYRRFDFEKCGYDPNAGNRSQAIAALRAWWAKNAR